MVPGSENSLGFLCDLMGFVVSLFLTYFCSSKLYVVLMFVPSFGGLGTGIVCA